jgi:hypothetical protein
VYAFLHYFIAHAELSIERSEERRQAASLNPGGVKLDWINDWLSIRRRRMGGVQKGQ